jgi:hypothetical protein
MNSEGGEIIFRRYFTKDTSPFSIFFSPDRISELLTEPGHIKMSIKEIAELQAVHTGRVKTRLSYFPIPICQDASYKSEIDIGDNEISQPALDFPSRTYFDIPGVKTVERKQCRELFRERPSIFSDNFSVYDG